MKSGSKKTKIIILGVITSILVIIGGVWFWQSRVSIPKTYPLGSGLEYVGEDGYGCYVICDANPNAIYYYATDMSVDEVVKYFKKATLDGEPRSLDGITDFTVTRQDKQDISIYYYSSKNAVPKDKQLKTSEKKYIISIPSFDYEIARTSL